MSSYYVKMFSDKVRVMNDGGKRSLALTADEARNLHTEIFSLLASLTELTLAKPKIDNPLLAASIISDGGAF